MIQFPCTCGHTFNVTDDQSGDDIQCPACGRLNSVPTAGDLALLNQDGTYKVDAPIGPAGPDIAREDELMYIFQKSRVDSDGREIDLRSHTTPLDYRRVGVDPIDILPERDGPAAPKYDPETGELVRPLEVEKLSPVRNVRSALPAPKIPPRRRGVERLDFVSPVGVLVSLCKPINLVVMSFIVMAHFAYGFITVIFLFGMMIVFLGPIMLFIAMISHYGNVIDETGPSSLDELPRPLRNLVWYDDLWNPFRNIVLAWFVTYGPAMLAMMSSLPLNARLVIAGVLAIIGTLCAPAVLLTTTTSGSIVNLRPDRVIGTAKTIGGLYPLLVMMFVVGVLPYLLAFVGLNLAIVDLFHWQSSRLQLPFFAKWYFCLPMLAGGIFLTHWFCWTLGQTYRVYHRQFPWEHQGPLRGDEDYTPQRGFAVLPPARKPEPTPLAALPIEEPPTRDDRLEFVRQSDARRRQESAEMIRKLPDAGSYFDP